MLTAVTAGFALSFGAAQAAESEYRAVAWDPETGSWAYVRAAEKGDQYEIHTIQAERQHQPYALEREDQQRQPARMQQQPQEREWPAAERERVQERERPAAQQQQQQQQWREALRPQPERQPRAEPAARAAGQVTLEGEIQGFREVRLRRGQQMPEQHTWVRLTLSSGYQTIVDIGREKDLADLDLERGDRIRVTGRHSTIAGQNVLIADRIRIGQETINIDRQKSPQEVSGTVREYEEISIEEEGFEDQLVVRFEMEDGRQVIAALGRDTSLDELEIEEDTSITIQGERTFVDGRPLLVARKIKVEGERAEIQQERRDREN
jgi:hypothetical protein